MAGLTGEGGIKVKRYLAGAVAGIVLAGCSTPPPPSAKFTQVSPDSGVNVWTEVEVSAGTFSDPAIVSEIQRLLHELAADVKGGRVKPGPSVKYVQSLIFVASPDNSHQKLGVLRFPVADFVGQGGDLNAADTVQFVEYGAARPYCADAERRSSNFCIRAAADAT